MLLVKPASSVGLFRDESDNRQLEAATASDADYLVSGDKLVVALGSFGRTEIITPARFLNMLENAQRL